MNRARGTLVAAASVLGALAVGIAFVPAGGVRGADPKPRLLVEDVDIKTLDLTDAQSRVRARIEKGPAAAGVQYVRLTDGAIAADTHLRLKVGTEFDLDLKGADITQDKGVTRVTWTGKDKGESVNLVSRGKDVRGLVYAGKNVYEIEPIGGGVHAVVRLDQKKFPPDHPKSFEEVEKAAAKRPFNADDLKGKPATPDAPLVLRALVAYTPKVEQLQTNVPLLVDSAVSITNTSYQNSRVGIRLELAHVHKVTYTEAGLDTDLVRFTAKADTYMDEVHQLRDEYRADVCVLLIDTSEACGKAAAILASEASAFAVVSHTCAVGNLSFAHEVGHLQGARHNPEVDPTSSPFAYGHGYLNPAGGWRTVMAYPTTQNPTRVPYWSNPNVKYPPSGEVMGTAYKHDNARVLNMTAPVITAFRP